MMNDDARCQIQKPKKNRRLLDKNAIAFVANYGPKEKIKDKEKM